MKEFKDKVIVVTGGARGIGKAIAVEGAKRGMNVVLNDIDPLVCETAKEIEAMGVKCVAQNADISIYENIEALLKLTPLQCRPLRSAYPARRGSRAAHPRPPLCPQGAQQCRLCISHLRLHRYCFICKQHRAVHPRLRRRLAGVQRRVRSAHEADEGARRQECDESRKQRIKQILQHCYITTGSRKRLPVAVLG